MLYLDDLCWLLLKFCRFEFSISSSKWKKSLIFVLKHTLYLIDANHFYFKYNPVLFLWLNILHVHIFDKKNPKTYEFLKCKACGIFCFLLCKMSQQINLFFNNVPKFWLQNRLLLKSRFVLKLLLVVMPYGQL